MSGVYRSEGGRAALIGAIKRGDIDLAAARALGVFFAVMCPHCEYGMSFEKPQDIPKGNVPCRCPGDYLIAYQSKNPYKSTHQEDITGIASGHRIVSPVPGRSIRNDPELSEDKKADLRSRYEQALKGSNWEEWQPEPPKDS